MKPLVVALGSEAASDDAAALRVVSMLPSTIECQLAGRPGASLLDLLPKDRPVVLLDVTRSQAAPGSLVKIPLGELTQATLADPQVSSHGFGPSESLRLGQALGRTLPHGFFVGIEGERFEVGMELSPAVKGALTSYCELIEQALAELR